jgi:DNA-binding transcriptional LysR family regulator
MELRHLRYFVAVAKEENVSRAALKLHVSQPALSRQIRDLEDEIGFKLFERSAKAVRLTDAGRVFLMEAQETLQRATDGVAAARAVAAGGRGEIHVGYAPSLSSRILPPTLRRFQASMPGVRIKLHDLSSEEMLTGLRDGKLHLALMARPAASSLRGLRFHELVHDPIRIALPLKHPLGRRRAIDLSEVVRHPLVIFGREDYPEYFEGLTEMLAPTKIRLSIAEEHDSVTSLIAAVEAGTGVAIVPESIGCIAGRRIKLIPVSPAPPAIVVGAISPARGLSTAAERFLEAARECAGEPVK